MAEESRFRAPKSGEEEEVSVEKAVSKSTRAKNKWATGLFEEWQRVRVCKFPEIEFGLFKGYEIGKVEPLGVK